MWPLRHTVGEPVTLDRHPVWADDGMVIGRAAQTLYVSHDEGETFVEVDGLNDPDGGAIIAARVLGDGELLVALRSTGDPDGEGRLYKSSGWDGQDSVSGWTKVLEASNEDCRFLNRTLDVAGSRVFATEYSGPRGLVGARRIWLSTDHGDTFTEVYDAGTEAPDDGWHMHGGCIDPWADNRLWACLGHTAHQRVIYSDDDGATWTTLTSDEGPTVFVATEAGVVVGTDVGNLKGVALITRDPVEWTAVYRFPTQHTQSWWAGEWGRAPDGTILLAYRVLGQETERPGVVLASRDGVDWHDVWWDDERYIASNGVTGAFATGSRMYVTLNQPGVSPSPRLGMNLPVWRERNAVVGAAAAALVASG